jgi:hypothetical protein
LYGELDDNVRAYETLDDLLLIKKVHLELHTPSSFLTKARELQKCVLQLRKNPDLLTKNDSALLKKILELVSEVGDVRNYNLSPIEATKELTTFYTRLFGGVCVFRNFESRNSFQMKRPDQEPYLYKLDDDSVIPLYDPLEDSEEQEKSSGQERTGLKTMVIYQQKDYQPEDGPVVQFIPLHDKERIIQFLVENRYADYSYDLLESRLSRLEDETFLCKEYDITQIGKEQQIQALHTYRESMLPEWYDLKEIKRKISKGHALAEIIQDYSADVKSMFLTPISENQDDSYVVEHLLTRLYDLDYEKMYTHNRRHLENIYKKAGENKQKYILHVLARQDDT